MSVQTASDLDQHLVQRACRALGLSVPTSWRRLPGGSGAAVFGVEVDGSDAVLKVTHEPQWRARARIEARIYRDERLSSWRPALLGAGGDEVVSALLLEAARPLPPVQQLSSADWAGIAHQLGALHRTRPGRTFARGAELTGDGWAGLASWSAYGAGAEAYTAAQWLPHAREWMATVPPVACHGDCHLDNIVLTGCGAAAKPVLIDWQQAHRGPGFEDLVFCWQRAEFAGARPPRTLMGLAYAAGRGVAADLDLRRQLAAAELQLLLLAWPPYLAYGDDAGRAWMCQRLGELGHDPIWSSAS